MKVLVLGGTQFFGVKIVEQLLARGDKVTVYSRGRRRPAFWPQIEHISGDRADRRTFVRALEGRMYDAVIDNIAYEKADLEASIQALQGKIGHYVLTSTGSVYDTDRVELRPIQEDDAPLDKRGDSAYADGKRECEQALIAAKAFPYTIVRPPIVLGPEDHSRRGWFWIQRVADGGPVLVPTSTPDNVFRLVSSTDLAAAIVTMTGHKACHGQTVNVAMDEIITLADFVRLVAEVLGKPDPVVFATDAQLKQHVPTYKPSYVHRFVLDTSRVKRLIDFRSTRLVKWLAETARWHIDAKLEDSAGYGHRPEELEAALKLRR